MAKYLNNRFKDLKVGVSGKTDSDNVLEVSGNVVATKFTGDGSGLTDVVATAAGIKISRNDSFVGTATTINFASGINVSTISSGFATVTVDVGKFSSNDTGIHTTSNVGIGTTNAANNSAADPNNTTILNVGIVTANYYYGDGSKLTNLSAISSIVDDTNPQLGGNLDLNSKNITGTGDLNITGVATFSGNLTVGGVLTYEDVTNIDSVGIVTARSGVKITGGELTLVGTAFTVGQAGIVTATSFSGSGIELTSLTGASADTYGVGNYTPIITVDSTGRITGITTELITSPATDISGDSNPTLGGDLDAVEKNITNVGIITADHISISGVSTFLGNVGIGTTNAANNSAADPNNTTILNVGIVTANYYYGNASKMSGLPEGGLTNISGDLTPDLGGPLNAQNNNISNVATIFADRLNISGFATVTNQLEIRSSDSSPGRVDFYCESNNAHYTRLQSAAHGSYSGNVTLTLPTTTGTLLISSQVPAGLTDGSNTVTNFLATGISSVGTAITMYGSTGIVSATAFYGNGTNLTGLSGGQFSSLVQDTNPQLGADLILNSSDITGTGNIDITGSVTATTFYGNGANLTGLFATLVQDTNPQLGGPLDAQNNNIDNVGVLTATQFVGSVSGVGDFDTGITSSVYINVNGGVGVGSTANNHIFSGPDSSFTFPNLSSKYKIESIHVTNKFNSEVYLSACHDFAGGGNIPIAQRVIVPYQGAVELVDAPFIANPLDILKLQALSGVGTLSAGVNGALDAFITYSQKDDLSFVGIGSTVVNSTGTDIFGVGIASNSTLQSIRLVNYNLSTDIDASISINNTATGQTIGFLAYNLTIPKNSVVEILERPKHLEVGQKIVGAASANDVLSVIVSGRLK